MAIGLWRINIFWEWDLGYQHFIAVDEHGIASGDGTRVWYIGPLVVAKHYGGN